MGCERRGGGGPSDKGITSSAWSTVEVRGGQTSRRLSHLGARTLTTAAAPLASPMDITLEPPTVQSAATPRLAVPLRRLASSTIDVGLVWGINVLAKSQLLGRAKGKVWEYDSRFLPQAPSAQRQMIQACRETAARPDFLAVETKCWVEQFRSYLISDEVNLQFPARADLFQSLLQKFLISGYATINANGDTADKMMWFNDEGDLAATYVRLDVGLSYSMTPAYKIIKYMALWDEVVASLNHNGSPFADRAWHTSRLWIRAEAEAALIDSTGITMAVSAGCGFIGALLFTRLDFVLSALVVLCVLGVTAMLAFFMTVCMRWKIGAVEVLGLIIFIGYSITYSLHIAHKYREYIRAFDSRCVEKYERQKSAVVHSLHVMACAVLGSAVTTLGSSIFLFFCTMQIFVKLAAVLFTVTFLALTFALVALPSSLLCIGPMGLFGCGAFSNYCNRHEGYFYGGVGSGRLGSGGDSPARPSIITEDLESEVFMAHVGRIASLTSSMDCTTPRSPTAVRKRRELLRSASGVSDGSQVTLGSRAGFMMTPPASPLKVRSPTWDSVDKHQSVERASIRNSSDRQWEITSATPTRTCL